MPYITTFIALTKFQCKSLDGLLKYTKNNNKIHTNQHKMIHVSSPYLNQVSSILNGLVNCSLTLSLSML